MRADHSIPVGTRQSLPVTTYLIRMILWFTYGTYRLSYGDRTIAADRLEWETAVTYRAGLPLVSEVWSCDLRAAAYAEAYSLGVCGTVPHGCSAQ